MKRNHLTASVLALAVALSTAGCSDSGNSTESASTQTTASASSKETLPGNLPKEVPVYEAKVYSVSDSEDGEWSFILETTDTKSEIAQKLNDAFSKDGWTIQNEIDLGDAGGQVTANNGTLDVRVVYTSNPTTREAAAPTILLSYDIEPLN